MQNIRGVNSPSMELVGLANTRISTDYAQKSPRTLVTIHSLCVLDMSPSGKEPVQIFGFKIGRHSEAVLQFHESLGRESKGRKKTPFEVVQHAFGCSSCLSSASSSPQVELPRECMF